MQSRASMLSLLLLAGLLLASVAGASTPPPAPAASPACLSAILTSQASAGAPEPAPAAGPEGLFAKPVANKAATCGACSDSLCAGGSINQICRVSGGRIYKCTNVWGTFCPADNKSECTCWFGPIP